MTSSPAPEEAIRLFARIAEMHSDQAPDSLVLWCDNAQQPETILTLGHARAIAAWNRRAGGEREAWQPIETAPKIEDDPKLLATEGGILPGSWSEKLGWYFGSKVGPVSLLIQVVPTHWQPLPASPRAALAGQTEGERNGG